MNERQKLGWWRDPQHGFEYHGPEGPTTGPRFYPLQEISRLMDSGEALPDHIDQIDMVLSTYFWMRFYRPSGTTDVTDGQTWEAPINQYRRAYLVVNGNHVRFPRVSGPPEGLLILVIRQVVSDRDPKAKRNLANILSRNERWRRLIEKWRDSLQPFQFLDLAREIAANGFPALPGTIRYAASQIGWVPSGEETLPERGGILHTFVILNGIEEPSAEPGGYCVDVMEQFESYGRWCPRFLWRAAQATAARHREWIELHTPTWIQYADRIPLFAADFRKESPGRLAEDDLAGDIAEHLDEKLSAQQVTWREREREAERLDRKLTPREARLLDDRVRKRIEYARKKQGR